MESGNRVETGRLAAEIEALLFVSDAPISIGRLSAITGESSVKTIKETVAGLEEFYRSCITKYQCESFIIFLHC